MQLFLSSSFLSAIVIGSLALKQRPTCYLGTTTELKANILVGFKPGPSDLQSDALPLELPLMKHWSTGFGAFPISQNWKRGHFFLASNAIGFLAARHHKSDL